MQGLPPSLGSDREIRTAFFLVDVTTERLNTLAKLFQSRELIAQVGTMLPLADIRTAHEMLAGAPHAPGKIVLEISAAEAGTPGG